MNIKAKSGSLIVDAACCMPIFLMAMCMLLFLIAQAGIEETLHYALIQSARCSARTYAVAQDQEIQSAAASVAFGLQWESILHLEWEDEHPNAKITRLSFESSTVLPGSTISIDHIVFANVQIQRALPFPEFIAQGIVSEKTVTFRPFVGESIQNVCGDTTRVYIFPKSGKRYHAISCSILQGGGVEALLTAAFREEKEACKSCNPQTLPNGSNVYRFTEFSGVYHKKSCPTITKCYVGISKGEAIAQGYTPCQLCEGGDH